MPLRRPVALLTTLLALGAAMPASAQYVVTRLPGYEAPVSIDSVGVDRAIGAPRHDVFRALVAAMEELKLPMARRDSVGLRIFQEPFVRRGSLAGRNMSSLFDCGRSLTGSNADTYRLHVAYGAWVDSVDAAQTRVRVGVLAGGEATDGAWKPPVQCASTGGLERRILELTAKNVSKR